MLKLPIGDSHFHYQHIVLLPRAAFLQRKGLQEISRGFQDVHSSAR